MSFKGLLELAFVVGAVLGAFTSIRSLRRIRQSRDYAGATLTWYEEPLSDFKYERANWLATFSLAMTVAVVGLLTILQLANPVAPIPYLPRPSPQLLALIYAITGGSSAYIGMFWGLNIVQPVAHAIGGRAFYALSDDGLLFAGMLFPWNSFDRATHHPTENLVRLWSALSPSTTSFTLSPLPPQSVSALLAALPSTLRHPTQLHDSPTGSQWTFPAKIIALCILDILLSWTLYASLGWLGVIANGILLFLFLRLSTKMLFRYSSGGKHRPAPVQSSAA